LAAPARRKYRHTGRLLIVLANVACICTTNTSASAQAHHLRFCRAQKSVSWLNRSACHATAPRPLALASSDIAIHAEPQEAIEDCVAGRNRRRSLSKEAGQPPRSGHRRKAAVCTCGAS